jgi:phosphoribosylformylglycinamidine cyclo-ligase
MRRTFNMGIGMVIVASQEAASIILSEGNIKAYLIGHVVEREGVIYN